MQYISSICHIYFGIVLFRKGTLQNVYGVGSPTLAWAALGQTSSSVRRHIDVPSIYNWNIVACDVKQPISLTPIQVPSGSSSLYYYTHVQYVSYICILLNPSFSTSMDLQSVGAPNYFLDFDRGASVNGSIIKRPRVRIPKGIIGAPCPCPTPSTSTNKFHYNIDVGKEGSEVFTIWMNFYGFPSTYVQHVQMMDRFWWNTAPRLTIHVNSDIPHQNTKIEPSCIMAEETGVHAERTAARTQWCKSQPHLGLHCDPGEQP